MKIAQTWPAALSRALGMVFGGDLTGWPATLFGWARAANLQLVAVRVVAALLARALRPKRTTTHVS